jgi:hypothetical protein
LPYYYSSPYTGTLTNAGGNADLMTWEPGDDKPLALVRAVLGQSTEIADAAEEIIIVSLVHMTATVTNSNGTSVTPTKRNSSDPASAATVEANGATVSTSSGTTTVLEYWAWNMRGSPLVIEWPEEAWQPWARQGEALILRCDSTVTDDVTIAIHAIHKEMG